MAARLAATPSSSSELWYTTAAARPPPHRRAAAGYTFVERLPSSGRGGTQRNVAVDALDAKRVAAVLGLGVGAAVGEAARQAGVGLAAGGSAAGGADRRLLRARLVGRGA